MDIDFSFDSKKTRQGLTATLAIPEPRFLGKKARFTIEHIVRVNDHRPVNDSKVLFKHEFKVEGKGERTVKIPQRILDKSLYKYTGQEIRIRCFGKLSVNDKLIFEDSSVQKDLPAKALKKPSVSRDVQELIEPRDVFSLIKNFRAIPTGSKLAFIGLLLIGLPVMALNTYVGIHDQNSPESATWVYSHYDSDGDPASPLFDSLLGSGGIGFVIWMAMRKKLRNYMTFRLRGLPGKIDPKAEYLVSDLVQGKSRADLKDVTLRIVACNLEKGQYVRGSGSTRRTISFSQPSRGVLLYSKTVALIPKSRKSVWSSSDGRVENHFQDSFSFETMFKALYPPNRVSSTHGLFVHWEVQLLLDDFVDQELVGSPQRFRTGDFFQS